MLLKGREVRVAEKEQGGETVAKRCESKPKSKKVLEQGVTKKGQKKLSLGFQMSMQGGEGHNFGARNMILHSERESLGLEEGDESRRSYPPATFVVEGWPPPTCL